MTTNTTGSTPQPMTEAERYQRLAARQKGYYYPWRSILPVWHGEDVFRDLVEQHLRPNQQVLEAACGHGELALSMALTARSVVAYDFMPDYIQLAKDAARLRAIDNVTFVAHDSSAAANGGRPRLPGEDGSYDLLVCSKGPFHWIEDAPRVARPGAVLLMLVPDATPLEPWAALLPEALRWKEADNPNWARPSVEQRLDGAGLALNSWWSFDVPEVFPTPQEMYTWLTWSMGQDEAPAYDIVAADLGKVFQQYSGSEGVAIRRKRYIWKAVVPVG